MKKFLLSWGKLRWEPATRWFDKSFAPIPKFDDKFARYNRYELPPEFPLASPYSGIVHHLSGPNMHAHTASLLSQKDTSPAFTLDHFHCALDLAQSTTRAYVRLLGPCFKTGRSVSPTLFQELGVARG